MYYKWHKGCSICIIMDGVVVAMVFSATAATFNGQKAAFFMGVSPSPRLMIMLLVSVEGETGRVLTFQR